MAYYLNLQVRLPRNLWELRAMHKLETLTGHSNVIHSFPHGPRGLGVKCAHMQIISQAWASACRSGMPTATWDRDAQGCQQGCAGNGELIKRALRGL